jgi:hypothetical protein
MTKCIRDGCNKKGSQLCSRCQAVRYCDRNCQKADWKRHKKTCLDPVASASSLDPVFAVTLTLPVEPDSYSWMDKSGGWQLGHTYDEGLAHSECWVLCNYQAYGPESNRLVLLGSHPCAGPVPTAHEAALAMRDAMTNPRHDTLSAAGPRVPCVVTIDGSLPASIRPEVKGLLKLLRVYKVTSNTKTYDPEDGWNDPWYRIEAGLLIRPIDLVGLFGHLIPPARRVPMPPRAWHLRPRPTIQDAVLLGEAAILRAASTENPSKFVEACTRAKKLPKRIGGPPPFAPLSGSRRRPDEEDSGPWCLGLHEGELFLWSESPREILNRSAVELGANGRPTRVEDVVAFTLEPMFRLGVRPSNLAVAQPSLCSMLDVKLYEDAYDPLGIVINMSAYDGMELEALPVLARQPWRGRPAAQGTQGSRQGPHQGPQAAQGSQASPASQTSQASPVFAEGHRVHVMGLVAQPELNGLCGTIHKFLSASGRWEVHLEGPGGSTMVVNVKPANLAVAVESSEMD